MNIKPPRFSRRIRLLGLTSIPLTLSLRTVAALAAATFAAGSSAAVLVSSHVPTSNQDLITTAAGSKPSESPEASDDSGGPTGHGAAVVSAVASCKAARPSPHASPQPSPGSRGIGRCVSAVASDGRAGGSGASGSGDSGTGDDTSGSQSPHPTPPAHPTGRGPSH